MQSIKENEVRGIAMYNSDTDDWTLVSPPASSSGGSSRNSTSPETSPERTPGNATTKAQQQQQQLSPPSTPATSTLLTEVKQSNLAAQLDSHLPSCSRKEVAPKKQANHKASSCKMVLDGANRSEREDDADDESDGMTEINLDENGIATIREQQEKAVSAKQDKASSNEGDWTDDDVQESNETPLRLHLVKSTKPILNLSDLHKKLAEVMRNENRTSDEPSTERLHSNQRRSEHDGNNPGSWFEPFFLGSLLVCSLFIIISCILAPKQLASKNSSSSYYSQQRPHRRLFNNTFDFLYSDPSNHAYTELKLLNEELADCIERANPVMRELAHWRSMNSKELSKYKTITNTRPFKGLVCYENEVKWRKRFNYLKTEFNFDLRKIIRQIKRRLTNDILVSYHPRTPFELVLNQLEYLDYVEQRRKDRALEKLKAENLDLLRRLNNRSSTSNHDKKGNKSHYNRQQQQEQQQKNGESDDQSSIKSLIILESENIRLRREVDSLKSRLAEKAGTVYIKQSIELEKCERENNALKQFHQDIADGVSKNLLKVGLHKAEAFTFMATNSKDEDSTSATLASTRHFFMKLSEEITKLLARNRDLEKDLTETRILNALVTREAQNLVEDANQTKLKTDNPLNDHQRQIYKGVERIIYHRHNHPEEEETADRLNVVPKSGHNDQAETGEENETKDASHYIHEEHNKDWLSKRAQLREQLRKSSRAIERHLSDLKRVPRSISLSSSSPSNHKHSNGRSHREHHQDRHSKNRDVEHKRLDSLKRLNKPNKLSSLSANSYNQNSQNNCKNHHRREEL